MNVNYPGEIMPKTSSGGQILRLEDIKKQSERRKTVTEEGRQKKEEETWKHEKNTLLLTVKIFDVL